MSLKLITMRCWGQDDRVGGVAFVYFVRKPLLSTPHDALRPEVVKLTAITSIAIWFTVAASGRWIGLSRGKSRPTTSKPTHLHQTATGKPSRSFFAWPYWAHSFGFGASRSQR